jgi:hypothetical protein
MMGKSKREHQFHIDENRKPEGENVFPIHPAKAVEGLGKQRPFGQLKVGTRFKFMNTASTPKGESPVFVKTETGRIDENDSLSDLCNYMLPGGGFKGWLPFTLPVIPID